MRVLYRYIILTLLAFWSTFTQAQDSSKVKNSDSLNIYKLDLAELLNMEVTVASKTSEKVSDAPGMVTSYSSSDIENYGYYNLSDLSSITSGYSNYTAFGEKMFET